MNLQAKVLKLKLEGATAVRHALWWEKQIAEHGEQKATAFYKHLGLNHLEKKSVEWEGLTLSREPTEAEKRCVKSIAGAQESSKEKVTVILLDTRNELIKSGLKAIKKLSPAEYHTLILTPSDKAHEKLRDRLISIHKQGRSLVAAELGKEGKEAQPEEFDELDELTDLTDARIANDIQSRITAAATRFRLLGLTGDDLDKAIEDEIRAGSVSYIDRAATGVSNKVLALGRTAEADDRKDEWDRVEYSALLDQNVCEPCASEDGKTAASEDDLADTPNPDCAGGDWCRCFHVWVNL